VARNRLAQSGILIRATMNPMPPRVEAEASPGARSSISTRETCALACVLRVALLVRLPSLLLTISGVWRC